MTTRENEVPGEESIGEKDFEVTKALIEAAVSTNELIGTFLHGIPRQHRELAVARMRNVIAEAENTPDRESLSLFIEMTQSLIRGWEAGKLVSMPEHDEIELRKLRREHRRTLGG